jgi:hypothetical protein
MTAQSIGGVLGAIVAAVVLAAAFYFVPVGPFAKPAKVDVQTQPVQTVPVAPAPRGPVVREVPN